MKNAYVENTIDFSALFNQAKKKWYLFLISLILVAPLTWLYATYSPEYYYTTGSILVKKQESGSYEINEALSSDYKSIERNILLRDEISKIKSNTMIRKTLDKLPFQVSYYTVESFWPNFLKKYWLNEVYSDVPFLVEVDSAADQLTGLLVHMYVNEEGLIELDAEGEEVTLYNYKDDKSKKVVAEVSFKETLNQDDILENELFSFRIIRGEYIEPGVDYYFKLQNPKVQVTHYQEILQVTLPNDRNKNEDSRVIEISLISPKPDKDKVMLSELVATYRANDLLGKNEKGKQAVEFLTKKVKEAEDSLYKANLALQVFQTSSGISDINNNKQLSMSQLSMLIDEKNGLENKLAYYQQTLIHLNADNIHFLVAPSSMGVEEAVSEKLILQYIDLKAEATRTLNYETQSNPLVDQIEGELRNLRNTLKSNIESLIETTTINLENVNFRINNLSSQLGSLPRNEQRLIDLEKVVEYHREKYDLMIRKKADAELTLATNRADVETIDKFESLVDPIAPNKKLIYALGLFIALILPLSIILPQYIYKKKLIDKDDIEFQTEVPLLGMIANGPKNSKIVTHDSPNSFVAESFEYVRINLQYYFKDEYNKLIGLTSSVGGEGKTFCSCNLAGTFAGSGLKTLIIGADLRKPKLQQYFDVQPNAGLSNYLDRESTIDGIICPSNIPNLDVIFSGTSTTNPIKLLESHRMRDLLEHVRNLYDKVIIDTPPIGLVADYLLLQRFFDVNIFVARNNYTDKNNMKLIKEIQETNDIKNLNLVFNDVKSFSGYGYIKNTNGSYKRQLTKS